MAILYTRRPVGEETDSACGIGVVITDVTNVRYIYCHLSSRTAPGGAVGGRPGAQSFLLALYDGLTPPNPATLPTTGCYYSTPNGAIPLLDYLN